MVLRDHDDPLNQSKGIMGPLENSTGVQNNRGRLRQRFDLIRKLGQGTYGKVQLGIDKETGQEVAIKTIKKSKIETEADLIRIRREIQIMSSVRHPNIIHIYEVFENREKMVLVMEYAAGGELYDYLNDRKVLKEDEARRIFRQIASAVYYCHKHKICHRDLKLENILLDESTNAKIADFGLSNVFDNSHLLKTFCGSPLYASPEIVRGTPYCGPEVDCWSLGVLLYTLVYGAMPFDGSNFKRLVKQISNGDYYEPKKTAEASSLIKLMLTVDSIKRATIKDVCSNAWINEGFDQPCLLVAEELANATPVRLDILLSLSAPINSTNVVIEKQADTETPNAEASKVRSDAKAKPKVKRGGAAQKVDDTFETPPNASKPKTPSEVKKKQVVKKKSKSSPLLELIVDVEEENEREVDDECGDTLSEISEIQTIAEGESEIKSKEKMCLNQTTATVADRNHELDTKPVRLPAVKKAEDALEKVLNKHEVQTDPEDKTSKVKPKDPPQVSKVVLKKKIPNSTQANSTVESKVPETKPIPPQPKELEKVQVPSADETAEDKTATKVSALKGVDNKVSLKPAAGPKATDTKITSQPATEVKAEVKAPVAEVKVLPEVKAPTANTAVKVDENKTITENQKRTVEQPSVLPDSQQKEVSPPKSIVAQKSAKLKQRSDSTNSENTSPTRIERRNSKVISQKTAELIQNLETKTSTGQDAKGKKFVFPSLKVSDAKSRFESSNGDSTTKLSPTKPEPKQAAEKEKKPTLAVELKPKLKSVSPSPSDATQSTKNGTVERSVPAAKGNTGILPQQKAENQKPKLSGPQPVPLPSTVSEKNVETSILKTAPQGTETDESNSGLKVENLKGGTSSPRRSRSPRKPDSEKVEKKEESVTKPAIVEDVKSTAKEHEVTTKLVSKLKPQISGTNLQNLRGSTITRDPSPVKPIEIPISLEIEKQVVATDSGFVEFDNNKVQPSTKEKLISKTPSQSKEQAAKKIGSVIQKIVSSESVDKGLATSSHTKIDSKPAFRTEIQKFVVAPEGNKPPVPANKTQRTEVTFPVAAAGSQERIIPIKLTDDFSNGPTATASSSTNNSGTNVPRSNLQRMDSAKSSNLSFSRQNSSDTESSVSTAAPKHELLKKSPREFIIPIKMESSGHTVTPKEEILNSESSITEDNFRLDSRLRSGRFGRQKRYNSLLSDSSFEDDPVSGSNSAATSRRSSAIPTSHARSLSQGDDPKTPETPCGTFKTFRHKQQAAIPLDRSDSCSSADEDEEDAFEVLTAESLFTSLLDRVRNLTKRLNRDSTAGPSWASGAESPSYGLWGNSSPLQEFMSRAPSETRSFMSPTPSGFTRSYSREPSVTVTVSTGPGWRQSLSREMSGESDSVCSEAPSISGSNNQGRSYSSSLRNPRDIPDAGLRTLPLHLQSRRQFQPPFRYNSQLSEPGSTSMTSSYSPTRPAYGRTMSNADYSTHSTLPLRRPVRAYERSYTGREYSGNVTAPINSSISSPLSAALDRGLRGSSIVSPRLDLPKIEPSSGFPRYRSLNRTSVTPDPERFNSAVNGDIFLQSPTLTNNGTSGVETNGWVGGSTSSSTQTTAAKLSTQEKMNNYQNYYYNLNKHPSRRLDVLNPAANPHLSGRPLTMYETSFIDNGNNSMDLNRSESGATREVNNVPSKFNSATTYLTGTVTVGNRESSVRAPDVNEFTTFGSSMHHESSPVPSAFASNVPIRKRPEPLSIIRQHRPFSISSFNDRPSGSSSAPVSLPPFHQPQQAESVPEVSYSEQIMAPSADRIRSPVPFSKPVSPQPQPEFSFVRNEAVRLTSSPPLDNERTEQAPTPVPKLKRDARATSVEKITRFLERKSKPREIPPPAPQPQAEVKPIIAAPENETETPVMPVILDKQMKSGSTSKISKPKFIQSLEKKWGKFANRGEENVVPSPPITPAPEGTGSDENSEESANNSPNESVLLQRAISPEKKPKSKFGATTVNFMLGKFRKMEEVPPNKSTPATCGKPPIGVSSVAGKRFQSSYAGARSDSVLTLQNQVYNNKMNPFLANSPSTEKGSVKDLSSAKAVLMETIDLAKLKNPVPPNQITQEKVVVQPPPSDNSEKKVARRPLSLGIFSTNGEMSKSSSFIPRFNKTKNTEEVPARVQADIVNQSINNNLSVPTPYNNEVSSEENPTTPTSDSFDSASVSSEKTEISMKSSALDDEESVSDRIFRKSFYSRFNSLDRNKSPTSATSVAINRHNNSTMRSATCANTASINEQPSTSFLPRINKYNPNPLFKELITDEFKSRAAKKHDYTRRVTSKLSKLLSEIESDIESSNNHRNREFSAPPCDFEKVKSGN